MGKWNERRGDLLDTHGRIQLLHGWVLLFLADHLEMNFGDAKTLDHDFFFGCLRNNTVILQLNKLYNRGLPILLSLLRDFDRLLSSFLSTLLSLLVESSFFVSLIPSFLLSATASDFAPPFSSTLSSPSAFAWLSFPLSPLLSIGFFDGMTLSFLD